ncbi:MAG TPA: hypothetical protein VHD32_00885 [Candidatus Didemnitutus sp.]|nr:hypothetical protein [Candidatus Didemnitutus sp.]
MKTTLAVIHAEDSPNVAVRRPRYQIYRQGQAGNYHPEFGTDSADEAVEAFLATKPAFEGGAMHLWDSQEQRSGASVRWGTVETEFGFAVCRRINIFHDAALGSMARQVLEREALRQEIQQSAGMSV